jgi:hypothetical protein
MLNLAELAFYGAFFASFSTSFFARGRRWWLLLIDGRTYFLHSVG